MNGLRSTNAIDLCRNTPIRAQDTQDRLPKLEVRTLVEIRPLQEILSTLDQNGRLDGIPFMPEMEPFCGKRLRISGHALKVCTRSGARQLHGTVHLEDLRCDGSAHLNCQARCLLFWKEAWIRPVQDDKKAHLNRAGLLEATKMAVGIGECEAHGTRKANAGAFSWRGGPTADSMNAS